MIKTVIFDIGGVLVNLHFDRCIGKYAADETMKERLFQATLHSPIWREYDRGVWSDEKLLQEFCAQDPEISDTIEALMRDFEGLLDLKGHVIPWIEELREKGYQVLYLSNWPRRFHKQYYHELRFVPYTDGGIFSYLEKVIKPDPAIYQLLLDRYELDPAECVFLDDTVHNLTAAEAFGIQTIHYTSYEKAREQLAALGVE